MYRKLPISSMLILNQLRTRLCLTEDDLLAQVSVIQTFVVTQSMVINLQSMYGFTDDAMTAILFLLRQRDLLICTTHNASRSNEQNKVKGSIFYDIGDCELIMSGQMQMLENKVTPADTRFVYFVSKKRTITVNTTEEVIHWTLFVVDTDLKKVWYLDPLMIIRAEATEESGEIMRTFQTNVEILLNLQLQPCQIFPHQYYNPCSSAALSGIYMFAILYFMVAHCPIYFTEPDVDIFADNLAYWMFIDKCLPY